VSWSSSIIIIFGPLVLIAWSGSNFITLNDGGAIEALFGSNVFFVVLRQNHNIGEYHGTQEHVLVLSLLAISDITCEIEQRAG
jgi:hypothetical protein